MASPYSFWPSGYPERSRGAVCQLFVSVMRTIIVCIYVALADPRVARDEHATGTRAGARHFQNWRTISSQKKKKCWIRICATLNTKSPKVGARWRDPFLRPFSLVTFFATFPLKKKHSPDATMLVSVNNLVIFF